MLVRSRSGRWILTFVLGFFAAGCQRGASEPAQRPPPRVSVAHPVVRQLIDEDDYNGWLQASQTVDVRARVRGHIQKICFKDGDMVQRDQLLLELDPRPFQAAVDQALAQAHALDAQKIAAEKNVARVEELLKVHAVAGSEYDQAIADANSFVARIAAEMQVVATNKLDLEYSRIKAPIAGRIGRALLTEGNLVNAGGTDPVLATIVAIDPIYVYFTIDERSMQRYLRRDGRQDKRSPGSLREQKIPFTFGLDTDEGYPHQGVIDFADNKVNAGTGTIEVRGVVQNSKGLFIPGSRVRVRIPVSDKYSAMLVPDTAVNTDQDQKYLLMVDEKDGNIVKKCQDVHLGKLLDDGMRAVLRAKPELKENDWIIVEGLQRARLNYPVEPIPPSK
jgi:RND family efflux transporter MFP subunit